MILCADCRNKRNLYKTVLCVHYYTKHGICPYKEKCLFAHHLDEMPMFYNDPNYPVACCHYRRMICTSWMITGQCPYGNRCDFIHDCRIQDKYFYSSVLVNVESIPLNLDHLPFVSSNSNLYDPPFTPETKYDYDIWYSFVDMMQQL